MVVKSTKSGGTSLRVDLIEPLKVLESSIEPLTERIKALSETEGMKSKYTKSDSAQNGCGTQKDNIHTDLPHLGSSLDITKSEMHTDIEEVALRFRRGALVGFLIWVTLLFLVFRYAPKDSYDVPVGIERNSHLISFILLLVTNVSRIVPLVLRENGLAFLRSGILVGTITVQCIAMASNLLMCSVPTPVMVDQVTGQRVFLVRWAEWTALAFLMTFLTDNIDTSVKRDGSVRYTTAILLAMSTVAGGIFPFCRSFQSWMITFITSWILFSAIYLLFYKRAVRYAAHNAKSLSSVKKTTSQIEEGELMRSSYVLCAACCGTWTLLALTLSIFYFGPIIAPTHRILSDPMLPEVGSCFFEIASKIWYLSALIDAYDKVFDESTRAVRRLEELRNFMSAVWETSSDVIVFCTQNEKRVSARISPAFLKLVGFSTGRMPFLNRGDISLILEVFPEKDLFYFFAIDLSKPVTREDASRFRDTIKGELHKLSSTEKSAPLNERNLAIIAKLAIEASSSTIFKDDEHSMMQDLYSIDSEGKERIMACEAKVAKLDAFHSVIVLRDISDRVERFEAEKRLVKEITIRKKDAEANRFTRHEVKNGILATIGLLDHLRETMEHTNILPQRHSDETRCNEIGDAPGHGKGGSFSFSSDLSADDLSVVDMDCTLNELDSTMRDILDTILDEAMAREIIYGEYQPKKERMHIPDVLGSLRRRSSRRFPLTVMPEPFPLVAMDRQLLRYIYRNAVSNACKYGQFEGTVTTSVIYKNDEEMLVMEVINLPGDGHDELLQLSPDEVSSVFLPGTQLEATRVAESLQAHVTRNESSGNGAWIMQKCAESLGGRCDIRFEENRTVFTFKCPVQVTSMPPRGDSASRLVEPFFIPRNTWGIVVDDSNIQRKLLDRFLKLAGIENDKRLILGRDANEVFSFANTVKELLMNNPHDKCLLIADENLDIVDGGARHQTVSGSRMIEKLRDMLSESEESRLLALIRSANDSFTDLELYKSRAHGYLLKEPIRKENILDVIKPWWMKRFSIQNSSKPTFTVHNHDEDNYGPSADDIRVSLSVVTALCSVQNSYALKQRWRTIREKLHTLKGDLMTLKSKEYIADIVDKLDPLLDHDRLPDNFMQHWVNLQLHIENIL